MTLTSRGSSNVRLQASRLAVLLHGLQDQRTSVSPKHSPNTEREARVEERRINAEECKKLKDQGSGRKRLTLDQCFGKYWEEHAHKLGWASEVERYGKEILKRVDKDMLIEELTDSEVNDFVQDWVSEERGHYALNRALAIWRSIHRRARRKWKQAVQEIDWTDFMNDENKRVAHFTLEQARLLMGSFP